MTMQTMTRGATSHAFVGTDVLALATRWDALHERSEGSTAFMSWAWLRRWIEPQSAIAFVVSNADDLNAGLLVEVKRRHGIRYASPVGSEFPSYQGVLCDGSQGAIESLAECVASTRLFDTLVFPNLWSEDAATHSLLDALIRKGLMAKRMHRAICPAAEFTDADFESFMRSQRSSRSNQRLRQYERRIQRQHDMQISVHAGKEISGDLIRRVAEVQKRSWLKTRGAANLHTPFYQQLLLELAQVGRLSVWLMTLDDIDAAIVCTLTHADRMEYTWPAFDLRFKDLKPGSVLLVRLLRDAAALGYRTVDFGHGDAEYKLRWANKNASVSRVAIGHRAVGIAGTVLAGSLWRAKRSPILRRLHTRAVGLQQALSSHER